VKLDNRSNFIDGVKLHTPVAIFDITECFFQLSPWILERFEILFVDVDDVAFPDGPFDWRLIGLAFGVT
jgi:hypothetical protein